MLLTHQLAVLALANSIFALPHGFPQKQADNSLKPGCVRQGKGVVICTVTVTAQRPSPTNNPPPVNTPAPQPTTTSSPPPVNTPEPQPTTEAQTTTEAQPTTTEAAPASTSSSESNSNNNDNAGASGGQDDYMAVVSQRRSAAGLGALAQDSQLEGNARKTATDGQGDLVHELLPGTFGQVLATGRSDGFRDTYIQSWLCEIPTLPGLGGLCPASSGGDTETGHAEILSDPKYTKIGCAFVVGPKSIPGQGVWACDLA